jgi:hypothetical protein
MKIWASSHASSPKRCTRHVEVIDLLMDSVDWLSE